MTCLVIGASGQLGSKIVDVLAEKFPYRQIISTYNQYELPSYVDTGIQTVRLNLLEPNYQEIEQLVLDRESLIIFYCSALTNVDLCETNPELGRAININGLVSIMKLFPSSHIVYFSTDYVFDGQSGPYSELDIPYPLQEYGKQKLIAEKILQERHGKFSIIRTNMVWGSDLQKNNYSSRLIHSLSVQKEWFAADDEQVTPTFNKDLAEKSVEISLNDHRRIIHLAGNAISTRYQFALDLAHTFNLNTDLIKPVSLKNLNKTAKRPIKGGLKSSFYSLRGYQEALCDYKNY
jgi:dTDP-4-dehydrorhamnose reductase